MLKAEKILGFKGAITVKTAELLLNRLKTTQEFTDLEKRIRKKVYSVFVECIENIYKHSGSRSANVNDEKILPHISLEKQGNEYIITAGNSISNESINKLKNRLVQVNQLDKVELKALFEDIISKDSVSYEEGAGLGLITIALKSEKKINYNFTSVDGKYSYFEIKIFI